MTDRPKLPLVPEPPQHPMDAESFRRHGHRVIDWIADYWQRVDSYPVLSQVEPGAIRQRLPQRAPEQGESFEAILADVEEILMPGITHWQSPNFFAFFPSNSSPPSVLGDLLSSGLGIQGMLWATSPAATELETHIMDWLVEAMGLPSSFLSTESGGGVIQDTASSATLCSLLAAREQATDFEVNRRGGEAAAKLVAYTSTQAHSSIEKAVKIAGLGSENLRAVAVDQDFAIDPEDLERQIVADREAGLQPFWLCATLGTTSSSAMDPLPPLAEICQRHGLWFHVDAAMAGTAALCPEFQPLHQGLEEADSYCFNPHKWMLTNFDCTAFWVRDRGALIRTLTILPEYLKNEASEAGTVFDYRDWHIPLGRRFRSLKLWFVIRSYGLEGLRRMIRYHVALSQQFRAWVLDHPDFEISAPTPLNLVCFRHRGGDDINRALVERLNASGSLYLSHTVLGGDYVLRMSIGQARTEASHVEAAWQQIVETAAALASRNESSNR
ncbi:MAG: pyridoxal-dependent decarboxylase [Acidobacteriota bacterium]